MILARAQDTEDFKTVTVLTRLIHKLGGVIATSKATKQSQGFIVISYESRSVLHLPQNGDCFASGSQ